MKGFFRKGSHAEYEARCILRLQGYLVIRCYEDPSPPDLIVARNREFILLMIRQSHRQVMNAPIVSLLYGEEIERLRNFTHLEFFRKECWIRMHNDRVQDGRWKFYEVLPGGIRRIEHEWVDIAMHPDQEQENILVTEPEVKEHA